MTALIVGMVVFILGFMLAMTSNIKSKKSPIGMFIVVLSCIILTILFFSMDNARGWIMVTITLYFSFIFMKALQLYRNANK